MTTVRFYDAVDDALLKFAVILAKTNGKWVLCKHKLRSTLEVPGGHREPGEDICSTAKRELVEETGAAAFHISPVCVYSVSRDGGEESFGGLFAADIFDFEPELHSEIEKIVLMDDPPTTNWTYPDIQPLLLEEARRRGAVT